MPEDGGPDPTSDLSAPEATCPRQDLRDTAASQLPQDLRVVGRSQAAGVVGPADLLADLGREH